jgi:hypothetical protein
VATCSAKGKTAVAGGTEVRPLVPASLRLRVVGVGQSRHHDKPADDDGITASSWLAFHDTIRPAHALLFVTPTCNRPCQACWRTPPISICVRVDAAVYDCKPVGF